jgi:superfamily I DNA/RNA helicase
VLQDVLRSISEQTTKRGCKPIYWARHTSSDEEQAALRLALGVTNDYLDDNEWQKKEDPLNPHVAEVIDRVQRFAQLRGMDRIPKHLVASVSDQLVHARRAYGSNSARHVVTTIHGAKNCEFDNVCVIWSYKIPANAELQRRLLYNAVTRAKRNCLLFDFRSRNDCTTDSVIVLLGKPKPMFDRKKRRANNSKGQRNKKK